jgi:hypothetical protein
MKQASLLAGLVSEKSEDHKVTLSTPFQNNRPSQARPSSPPTHTEAEIRREAWAIAYELEEALRRSRQKRGRR